MKSLLFLCLGSALSQPFGVFDRSSYQAEYNPAQSQYLKPVAYSYLAEPSRHQEYYAKPYQHGEHQAKHHQHGEYQAKPYQQGESNYGQKMVGEQYFKYPGFAKEERISTEDELPYTLIKDYTNFEYREYPEANFACVKSEVDNSEDPLAGLENVDPFTLMSSQRWKKMPMSIMFKELFKYISGVNQGGHEVEMTRPVSTRHTVKKEQAGGNLEVQEMCFYISPAHQANPPQPLEKSPVYIYKRPSMRVFVHRFGGFALTTDSWQRELNLLVKAVGDRPLVQGEYFTNGYNSPFEMVNRRNEVWIQDALALKPADAADAAGVAVTLPADAAGVAVSLPADAAGVAVSLPADAAGVAVTLPAGAAGAVSLPADAAAVAVPLPAEVAGEPVPEPEKKPEENEEKPAES